MQRWEELEYARWEGRKEGKAIGEENALRSLMETMKWTLEEAMNVLQIPNEDREKVAKRING